MDINLILRHLDLIDRIQRASIVTSVEGKKQLTESIKTIRSEVVQSTLKSHFVKEN